MDEFPAGTADCRVRERRNPSMRGLRFKFRLLPDRSMYIRYVLGHRLCFSNRSEAEHANRDEAKIKRKINPQPSLQYIKKHQYIAGRGEPACVKSSNRENFAELEKVHCATGLTLLRCSSSRRQRYEKLLSGT